MADLHKAIRAIHNNAVTINGDTKESIVALDSSGNNVTINWTNVEAWTDPNEYQYKRAAEYPKLAEQFDLLYKDIVAGTVTTNGDFAKAIKAVKDKYTKE